MSDTVQRRILFVTKYNSCRGPAAEVLLRSIKPEWTVFSVASLSEAEHYVSDPVMDQMLLDYGFKPLENRPAMLIDWLLEEAASFEIHDLDREGIKHPFCNEYNYKQCLIEISEYIEDCILEVNEYEI